MKALLDTCVIMDAVQNREPFAQDAQAIFLAAANETFLAFVTAKAMTDIYDLTHPWNDRRSGRGFLGQTN